MINCVIDCIYLSMDLPTQLWVMSPVPESKVEFIHSRLERECRLYRIEQIVSHMEKLTQAKLLGPMREDVNSFCWLKIQKCTLECSCKESMGGVPTGSLLHYWPSTSKYNIPSIDKAPNNYLKNVWQK